jgi:uncharacterized zinc-type alcohol dehydrogenase-like protein
MKLLGLDGTIVLVGLPEGAITVDPLLLSSTNRRSGGSAVGGIRETQETLYFSSRHTIACDVEVIPIQKVNEGLGKDS